mmetsp:Transcript_3119/g.19229  ORF Transcript_3119/g.19229 Transcript_3119/m.19229 type:complete len:290 (-) Transcript_3119:943-1812(-)
MHSYNELASTLRASPLPFNTSQDVSNTCRDSENSRACNLINPSSTCSRSAKISIEIRCANFPIPWRATMSSGLCPHLPFTPPESLPASLTTLKKHSNTASRARDCKRPRSAGSTSPCASLKPRSSLLSPAFRPFAFFFRSFFRAFFPFFQGLASKSSSALCTGISAIRRERSGWRSFGEALHIRDFTTSAVSWTTSRLSCPCRSFRTTFSIVLLQYWPTVESTEVAHGMSALRISVRKLNSGSASKSPPKHFKAIIFGGIPSLARAFIVPTALFSACLPFCRRCFKKLL